MPQQFATGEELLDEFLTRRRPQVHNLNYEYTTGPPPTEADFAYAQRSSAAQNRQMASFGAKEKVEIRQLPPPRRMTLKAQAAAKGQIGSLKAQAAMKGQI